MGGSILVTGANGQLGNEFQLLFTEYPQYKFHFASKEEFSIVNAEAVSAFLSKTHFDFCINCAAYTAVDAAENDRETAKAVNTTAAGNLAESCRINGTRLIHISTDYVFDGTATTPYDEQSPVSPINVYGETKLDGEILVLQHDPKAIIIRTSWLYASQGKNFVSTMRRLMKEKDSISVVADQLGSPTYTGDLARAIMQIILSGINKPGIYHFSNSGVTNWYEFALAIKENINSDCEIIPIDTASYKTAAKRPGYSVLNTDKIKKTFNVQTPDWRESLKLCMGAF